MCVCVHRACTHLCTGLRNSEYIYSQPHSPTHKHAHTQCTHTHTHTHSLHMHTYTSNLKDLYHSVT